MKQNFPPVVPDSFALLGFAEIDKMTIGDCCRYQRVSEAKAVFF